MGPFLDNAIQFTKDDGTITVVLSPKDEMVAVSIADDGLGVAREELGQLFGKFVQPGRAEEERSGGTGLGLIFCKKLVELMGGTITMTSELGAGTSLTFTLPTARVVPGIVHAFDIEAPMVKTTMRKAASAGLSNVEAQVRDFVTAGTGLPDASIDYAMLFNILHCEQPHRLLGEAWRILRSGGLLAMMHWNDDASTPRGPSMDIRPQPQQCLQWAQRAGFQLQGPARIDLPPYHYGILLHK